MNTDEQRAALHTPSDSVKQGEWDLVTIILSEMSGKDWRNITLRQLATDIARAITSNTSPKNDPNAELVEACRNLEPLRDTEFHGKWRVHKVLDALAKHTTAKGK
jgi:hypothetical protein